MTKATVAPVIATLIFSMTLWAQEVPNTLDEAFSSLDNVMSASQREEFRRRPEASAIVDAHSSLGMYIRNNWFRAGNSSLVRQFRDLGAGSLDDVSSMILASYWRHLNGVPIRLDEQGSCYRKWWAEQYRLIAAAGDSGSYGTPKFHCP